MKRKVISLLFIPLLFHSFTLVFASTASDIAGHWAESTIIEWQNAGKISGYEDNTFRPDEAITRAEFVHLFNNMITMEDDTSVHFNDVTVNDWFYEDVSKAAANHIIAGFEDNTFRPNEVITRAQSASIVSNALQLQGSVDSITITDNEDIPEWSKNAVYAMLNAGYLSGYEDGSFGANKSMTRAEAISMLSRIEKNQENRNINEQYDVANRTQKDIIVGDNYTEEIIPIKPVWENGNDSKTKNKTNKKEKEEVEKVKTVIVITNDNVSDFYGKTLQDDVKIEINSDCIELTDIIFDGNVEVISNLSTLQTLQETTLFLKGNTKINHMTVFTPITINSENNIIETLITKAETILSGNTHITNLKCYDNIKITDDTIITDTAQISCSINANSNTKINVLMPNLDTNLTTKENISIYLEGNCYCNIIIPSFSIVENIILSDNTQSHITIENEGKLKEMVSFSQCYDTTLTNYGTVDSVIALDTETIIAENVIVEPAILQNITLLSEPSQLHYKEGDIFTLSDDISLLLEYQNNITKVVDNINEFDFYHIKTYPDNNTLLTEKENDNAIKIYSDDVSANIGSLEVDFVRPNLKEPEKESEKIENIEKTVTPPILSVNNTNPVYGIDDVIFTIENQENITYYYTLDNSEPDITSEMYTEPVILPLSEETSITIKAIAVEQDIYSDVSEITINYVIPIKDISLSGLEVPVTAKQISDTVFSENEEYTVEECYWKNGEEIVELSEFEAETVYTAEIALKASENYIFNTDMLVLDNILNEKNEKINDILIDEERSDENNLYLMVIFQATPPYPTEELAMQEFTHLYGLSVSVPNARIDDETFYYEAILESAQQAVSEYWDVEFELNSMFDAFYPLIIGNGTFTVISEIDSSVHYTNIIEFSINVQ